MKLSGLPKAALPTVVGVLAVGLLFKFGGNMPLIKDARQGLGG